MQEPRACLVLSCSPAECRYFSSRKYRLARQQQKQQPHAETRRSAKIAKNSKSFYYSKLFFADSALLRVSEAHSAGTGGNKARKAQCAKAYSAQLELIRY